MTAILALTAYIGIGILVVAVICLIMDIDLGYDADPIVIGIAVTLWPVTLIVFGAAFTVLSGIGLIVHGINRIWERAS